MVPKKIAILIDLSGTLHIEDHAIPSAIDALKRLLSNNLYSIKFVTNTTKESLNFLHERLIRCGYDMIEKSQIFTSLTAARKFIEAHNLRPLLFLEEEAMEDFEGLKTTNSEIDTHNPNAVVVGLAPSHFYFERMNEAFRLLLNPEAKLIAVHKGRYYKRTDGLALGPGPFVEALTYASGKEPIVVGKPEKEFFLSALESLENGILPENTIMIGDDVKDDILGAQKAGIKAILVKTGKYREGDEDLIPEKSRNVVNSFVEAVELVESGEILS